MIESRLGLSSSTMSFHLRKLEVAGLVSKSQAQYYTLYALRPEQLAASLGELVHLAPVDARAAKEQRRVRQYREQVVIGAVAEVLRDAPGAGQHVAVGKADALRPAGRTGCVQDRHQIGVDAPVHGAALAIAEQYLDQVAEQQYALLRRQLKVSEEELADAKTQREFGFNEREVDYMQEHGWKNMPRLRRSLPT